MINDVNMVLEALDRIINYIKVTLYQSLKFLIPIRMSVFGEYLANFLILLISE